MAVGNSNADALLIGADARGVFLEARGHIRAAQCYPLRDTVLSRLETAAAPPAVFIDLSACTYMDSTFIGLLVAIDRKLRKGSGGRLHVMDPSTECLELFRQLGLQDFLLVEAGGISAPNMRSVEAPRGRPGADFVLRAHEALMESSDVARRKFSVLRDVLERKLRGDKPRGDTH